MVKESVTAIIRRIVYWPRWPRCSMLAMIFTGGRQRWQISMSTLREVFPPTGEYHTFRRRFYFLQGVCPRRA